MNEDVILMAGTVIEHEVVTDGNSEWKPAPEILELGPVGEQSEPKEKTTLSDKIKKYGSGLRDAQDKNLKFQYIPKKVEGEEYYQDYLDQQVFIKRLRDQEEFNLRVKWPDLEVNGFLFKSLGFEWDTGTQEDWKKFTANGKQNSRVIYDLLLTGNFTLAAAATTQLAIVTTPADLDVSDGTVYWTSSVEATATVDANGLVTGVAAGVTNITAEFRGVSYTEEVTVS